MNGDVTSLVPCLFTEDGDAICGAAIPGEHAICIRHYDQVVAASCGEERIRCPVDPNQ